MVDERTPDTAGEFEIIRTLFAPLAGEGAFSLADDAATLKPTPVPHISTYRISSKARTLSTAM